MCGRYTLTVPTYESLAELLGVPFDPEIAALYRPRYNVAPTDLCFVLRVKDGARSILPAKWGLIPHFSKDRSGAARNINSRSETAASSRQFGDAFARRRCVVPADGFFEWEGAKDARRASWFHAPEGGLLYFAGLYERWNDPETKELVRTFTILTTPANDMVGKLHDRMPALLAHDQLATWLEAPRLEDARALLRPAPVTMLAQKHVSSRVNSVANDDAACLAEADPNAAPTKPAPKRSTKAKSKPKPVESESMPLFDREHAGSRRH